MTVYVGVYSVESFKNLTDQDWKSLRKRHAWHSKLASWKVWYLVEPTYPAREHGFIVNIILYPCHQMLDILRCRHFGRSLEILRVLPEVFESIPLATDDGLRPKQLTHQWPSSLDMTVESKTL